MVGWRSLEEGFCPPPSPPGTYSPSRNKLGRIHNANVGPGGAQPETILSPPEDVWQRLEIFLVVTTGEGDATGINGSRPRMLLNVQQGTCGPATRNHPAPNVSSAKVRSPAPDTTSSFPQKLVAVVGGSKLKKSTRREINPGGGTSQTGQYASLFSASDRQWQKGRVNKLDFS